LQQNAFGGRAPPEPAGGAIELPNSLAVIRGRGGEGKGRKEWEGEEGHVLLSHHYDPL